MLLTKQEYDKTVVRGRKKAEPHVRLSWEAMLWQSLPSEVLAAWSSAAVPDVDFHELSLTFGPTWSLPNAATQTPVCQVVTSDIHLTLRKDDWECCASGC